MNEIRDGKWHTDENAILIGRVRTAPMKDAKGSDVIPSHTYGVIDIGCSGWYITDQYCYEWGYDARNKPAQIRLRLILTPIQVKSFTPLPPLEERAMLDSVADELDPALIGNE